MFNRILVPLDGSRLAERTIPHAEKFAEIFGATIVLLRVLDPAGSGENHYVVEPLNWQIRKAEAEIYLQQIAQQLGDKGLVVEPVLLEGKTAESIIDFAQTENIDLLVMSTHGAGGLSRWNTSSVFHKVLNKVYQHVLIVRAYCHAEEDETGSFYRNIMLPIDCSRRSECTLSVASMLAERGGARLVLATVVKKPEMPISPPYSVEVNELIDQFQKLGREAATTSLAELQNRLQVPSEVRIEESDDVIDTIHSLSEREDIDLLIFCAHGQTGRVSVPYGSVVSNYIEYGDKPVLVIQDVARAQIRPTQAEMVAERYGKR